jgi:hypothetical protein
VALEPAERLQVIQSPAADLARTVTRTYISPAYPLTPEHQYTRVVWKNGRSGDFKNTAHLLYTMYMLDADSSLEAKFKNFGTLKQLEDFLSMSRKIPQSVENTLHKAFRVLRAIERDDDLRDLGFTWTAPTPSGKVPNLAPVEFMGAILLFAMHADAMSLHDLALAVKGMREFVRDRHKDVFARDGVTKDIVRWIRKVGVDAKKGIGKDKWKGKRTRTGEGGAKDQEKNASAMEEVKESEESWLDRVKAGQAQEVGEKGSKKKNKGPGRGSRRSSSMSRSSTRRMDMGKGWRRRPRERPPTCTSYLRWTARRHARKRSWTPPQ